MEKDLYELRKEIDVIDQQMAELFEKRMGVVLKVGQYKIEHNIPVLDASREELIIQKANSLIKDPELLEYYITYIKDVMKVSKDYQTKMLNESKK